jgi:ABC-type nickel/cobalt efflux system permease component RcnA
MQVHCRKAAGAALVLAALLAIAITSARAQELKPISPFAATEAAPPSAFAQRPVAAPFQSRGPLGGVFAWVLDKQQTLQRTLAMSVKGLKTDNPMAGALTLAALSFLYGILHAVGPGHGKTIISSYVVANEETVRRGVIISFIAAGLQALTAVALVGLLLFGLNATGLQINAGQTGKAELRDDHMWLYLQIICHRLWAIGETGRRRKLAYKSLKTTAGWSTRSHPAPPAARSTMTTVTIIAIITRREKRAIIVDAGGLPGRYRGESHGGSVLGGHQALHGSHSRARVCGDAGAVLGGSSSDLRHGARHRHYGRRARDARALARACA